MGQQPSAQRAAGVGAGKVLGLKAPGIEQGRGQGIAQGQLHGGAGRGGQVERAGFALDAGVQHPIGVLGQGGLEVARHGGHAHALAFEHGQQVGDFMALAAIGQGQHQIAATHHAQVAMAGLGRMHKKSGCAGRGQRGGNLVPHMAAFAHAHDDDPPAQRQNGLHHRDEVFVQALGQCVQRGNFNVQSSAGRGQRLGAVHVRDRGGAISHRRRF